MIDRTEEPRLFDPILSHYSTQTFHTRPRCAGAFFIFDAPTFIIAHSRAPVFHGWYLPFHTGPRCAGVFFIFGAPTFIIAHFRAPVFHGWCLAFHSGPS
jgi:hypothetical protein